MSDPTSYPDRQLIENEMVFRGFNEGVQKSFEKLKKIAKEDGQEDLVPDSDTPIHYYCECADENCRERVVIRPSEYNRIHKNRKRFVIGKDHQVPSVEKVITKKSDYYVVEKYAIIDEKPVSLNPTDVNNV